MTQAHARVLMRSELAAVLEVPLDGDGSKQLVQVDVGDISDTELREGAPIRFLFPERAMKDREHVEIRIPDEFVKRLMVKMAAISAAK